MADIVKQSGIPFHFFRIRPTGEVLVDSIHSFFPSLVSKIQIVAS